MIAILVDFLLGWLIAARITAAWLSIVGAIVAGIVVAFASAAFFYWYFQLIPGQAAALFIRGVIIHTLLTVIATLVARWLIRRKAASVK